MSSDFLRVSRSGNVVTDTSISIEMMTSSIRLPFSYKIYGLNLFILAIPKMTLIIRISKSQNLSRDFIALGSL